MNTVIDASQIQKGDKIRVTYETYDTVRSITGVTDSLYRPNSWYTKEDVHLQTNREDSVIELLERVDRRDELATQFAGGQVKYVNAWPSTKRAIDFIIEAEKKEAK